MSERLTLVGVDRRVDKVEAAQTMHEELCAERYQNIDEKLGTSNRRASRIELAAWSVLVTLVFALFGALLKMGGFV